MLARVGEDVDPLEEVGVAGVGLDLRLSRRSGQRQGRLDLAGDVLKFDQLADLAEVFQLFRAEVQHGDLVAKGAGADIDRDLVGGGSRGGGQPLDGVVFVQLHAEAFGGINDLLKFLVRC